MSVKIVYKDEVNHCQSHLNASHKLVAVNTRTLKLNECAMIYTNVGVDQQEWLNMSGAALGPSYPTVEVKRTGMEELTPRETHSDLALHPQNR